MNRPRTSRLRLTAALLIYAAIAAGVAMAFHQNTLRTALTSLHAGGAVRLSEAISRLRLQIDGYRSLVNVIANDPQVVEALRFGHMERAASVLANFEATYGAWRIDLTTPDGQMLATSAPEPVTLDFPAALLSAAMNNRLGFAQASEDDQRIIRLSRGVLGDGRRPVGVVIVSVSLSALEFEWPVSPEPIVFFNAEELSFVSNRPVLLQLSRGGDPEVTSFDLQPKSQTGGIQLWRFDPPDGAVQEVIKAEQYVPHLDLTGVIFLDTFGARSTARLRAILVLAGAVMLGLIGTVALQQRRRRVLEEQYSAELEARVDARTQELRDAQGALVEASKLAALGRLSAGVSHELNQPLAAILNFAENGQKLLAKGRSEPTAQNLTLISDQVRRITRIIGNLRAFARQEATPTERIEFGSTVDAALTLAQDDIRSAGATVETQRPDEMLYVLAGRVRLEQVILNLITNALDAMAQTSKKTLRIHLQQSEANAVLTVADTGHGIADPSSVFEPFYSTKDLGASKGLGMGLALSFGLISSFGGSLSCRNLDQGAEFKVTLPIAEASDA